MKTQNHPFESTLEGYFEIEDRGSGEIFRGPAFKITMTDNCCEGHAQSAAEHMARTYVKAQNTYMISAKWDIWRVVFDEG